MVKLDCSVCVFGDLCPTSRLCRHFSPVGEIEGLISDALIETAREAFYDDWREYIRDNGDALFF